MNLTKYTYTISSDFPNSAVDLDRLTSEITTSDIAIAFDSSDANGDLCDIWFKENLSTEDQGILDNIVANHSGEVLEDPEVPLSPTGIPLVQWTPQEGRREEQFTIDLCDKTSWFHDTTRIEQEVMIDSGDHLVYTLTTPCYIVDAYHGKIFGEDKILGEIGVVVTVNDIAKTIEGPDGVGGDFGVDFVTGTVNFKNANQATDIVKITYSRVNSSLCKIVPPDGKLLKNTYVEVQFTEDIEMNDNLVFELWGVVDYFAPQYIGANLGWGVIQSGDKIPLSSEVYKTLFDFIIDAEKAYPVIPVFQVGATNNNWRHYTKQVYIFRFDYQGRAVTMLDSAVGMEIRIRLENNIPFGGEHAIATFYCKREG